MESTNNICGYESSDEEFLTRRNKSIKHLVLLEVLKNHPELYKDSRNRCKKVDRLSPINFINTWSDDLFKKQFRMSRFFFNILIKQVISNYPGPFHDGQANLEYSYKHAKRCAGSHIFIEIKLLVTLRLLAGASYLDMIWYGIDIKYSQVVFIFMVQLLLKTLPEIKLPSDEAGFLNLADGWTAMSLRKKCIDALPGVVLAFDGFATQILAPTTEDRKLIDCAAFCNRKGFHGVVCQVGCDVHTIFYALEVRWPGATSDITAWEQSNVFDCYVKGLIPPWAFIVFDEIYSCFQGDLYLCPYSKRQLRYALETFGEQAYRKLKCYNNAQSGKYFIYF